MFDVAVIGGGVVGLAIARALAPEHEVVLLERHPRTGTETSSRNSGVIHAGLYYAPGSLEAETCVEGRERLYAYAARKQIPHRRTGKLVVATDAEETAALSALFERGVANGAGDLEERSAASIEALGCRGVAGLWSPESGIVDAHAFLDALRADAVHRGATLATGVEVVALERTRAWRLVDASGDALEASLVVNAAGLGSDRVAAMAGVDVDARGWRLSFWKGDYFALSADAPKPAPALVYPLPVRGGLGIHLTRDLGGRVLAGPDAAPVTDLDYAVDESRRDAFAASVARYLPGLRPEHLTPDYRGIRPKRGGFVLERVDDAIHLVGIESPGLTAALALAERVRRLASGND